MAGSFKRCASVCLLSMMILGVMLGKNLHSYTLSQSQVIGEISEIKANWSVYFDPTRKSGTLSSYFSKTYIDSDEAFFKERDFEEHFITNEEGYTRRVYIHLPEQPRPFIFCVAGVGGGASADSLLICSQEIRKKYDWGMVLIENNTSSSWIKRNERLVITGYEAGWDLYLTIKELLQMDEIREKLMETHLIGMSLGGNDVAFAAYFDSVLETHLIDGSVMAVSSPVDRFATLAKVRKKQSISASFIRGILKGIYKAGKSLIQSYYPISADEFAKTAEMDQLWEHLFIPSLLDYLTESPVHEQFFEKIAQSLGLENTLIDNMSISEVQQVLRLPSVLPMIDKPLLFLNAKNDPIIDYHTPITEFSKVSSELHLGQYTTKYGGHVGYYSGYGDGWMAKVVRTYISYFGKKASKYYNQPSSFDPDAHPYNCHPLGGFGVCALDDDDY